jgi:hypothetical protein
VAEKFAYQGSRPEHVLTHVSLRKSRYMAGMSEEQKPCESCINEYLVGKGGKLFQRLAFVQHLYSAIRRGKW